MSFGILPIDDIKSCGVSADKSTDQKSADVPSGETISREEVHKVLSLLATEGGKDAKLLFSDAHEFIDALPSADRPKGEWVVENHEVVCSVCGQNNLETNFCPNCGARMKGGAE